MIIDANVFIGYFHSTIGSPLSLSGCPVILFILGTPTSAFYHDIGRLIENEWQTVVDREWFEPWFASQLMSGVICYVDPIRDAGLERNLTTLGFPTGRDIVYVRVGLSVVATKGSPCTLFTEDMDFYDPKKKGCAAKTRAKLLSVSSGPVCKILGKKNIEVSSVP